MKKNRGSITVEASIVVSLFLFFMLAMAGIYMMLLAEAHIHQALAEATDYVAQYCYLEQKLFNSKNENIDEKATVEQHQINIESLIDTMLLTSQFNTYLGQDFYVERMIVGGKNGVVIKVKKDKENSKIMLVTASYQAKLYLPLLGTYSIYLSNQIKQKAFVGFSEEEYDTLDRYVFVTPNREAYHMRRDCTHLMLDVKSVTSKNIGGYTACFYCGKDMEQNKIYIAKTGAVYHSRTDCVGLRRTVRRVKLSSVKSLGACSRCGG